MDKPKFLEMVSNLIDENNGLAITIHVPHYDNDYKNRSKEYAKKGAEEAAEIIDGLIDYSPQSKSEYDVGTYAVRKGIDFNIYFNYREV